jgi:ribosomal protein L11 methyltransferase
MEWLEVSVTGDNETAEAVAEVLSRYAYHGVVIEAGPEGWNSGPVVVRAYLPADDQLEANRRQIEEGLWHLGQILPIGEPAFEPLADKDWSEAWKERLQVLHIGAHFVVRPSWREYVPRSEDVVIELDPGQAFGTGLHPTTQMCLMALEEFLSPGACVDMLDLGTGSGILAVGAAKLGARCVLAVDNDPVAVRAARTNVLKNGVADRVRVVVGSLDEATDGYHLVVANILANVILAMVAEGLTARVRPEGAVVVAGILADQESDIATAFAEKGYRPTKRWQIDDWVCLALSQSGQSLCCADRL